MKKHIISILLVMAIIFTMAACAAKPTTQETLASPVTVEEPSEEVAATEETVQQEYLNYLECYLKDGSDDEPLDFSRVWDPVDFSQYYLYDRESKQRIGPDEVSNYIAKMVSYTSPENFLSWYDMDVIGYNFALIWRFGKEYRQPDFNTQALTALNNVLEQSKKNNVVCDIFHNWSMVPVFEVLCKFYSYDNFAPADIADDWWSLPFEYLSEEEVLKIAEIFFNNPAFVNNTLFALNLLSNYPNGIIADMAFEQLANVTKSTKAVGLFSEDYRTGYVCSDIFKEHPYTLSNVDKITEIAKNILQNDTFNFVKKYSFLCSNFYSESGFEDVGKKINDMAYDSLFELAQNASKEDYKLIVQTVIELYHNYGINSEEVNSLLSKYYNVKLLISCLADLKEITSTKLPVVN